MGEIIIKIPSNKKRHYLVTDPGRADALIDDLERSAIRLEKDARIDSPQGKEDARDAEAALRNLDEMRRTGVSHSVDELRKEFGLS